MALTPHFGGTTRTPQVPPFLISNLLGVSFGSVAWLGDGRQAGEVCSFVFFKWRTEALRRTKTKFLFQGFRVSGSEITFSRFLKEADVPCLGSTPYIYAGFRKQV